MKSIAIRIVSSNNQKELARLFSRRTERLAEAERVVAPILKAVRREGDRALVRYARRWDGFEGKPSELAVRPDQISAAAKTVSAGFRKALRQAARQIRQFCRLQMPKEWHKTTGQGINVGQLVRPLESVGCYIPGG